jgi:S1-C subfamily serine protease
VTVTPTGTATPTPAPLTTPEIVQLLLPSVVQVAVDFGNGQGVGTGVVYDDSGRILTNWHVIDGARTISVGKPDGSVVPAQAFRWDPLIDLAIIVVEDASGLVPATFGDSGELKVGEDVIAIGYALGLAGGPTVSKGVVSALNRTILGAGGADLTGLIQTDAAINNGNSGGPLVNSMAEVIGINTARLNIGERVGFAIGISTVIQTADRLISLGPPPPPGFLGVGGEDMGPALAVALGLPPASAFIVRVIGTGSPAEVAGLLVNDVITQIDNAPITSGAALTQFLRDHPAGTTVTVFLWRMVPGSEQDPDWEIVELQVTLSERPEDA